MIGADRRVRLNGPQSGLVPRQFTKPVPGGSPSCRIFVQAIATDRNIQRRSRRRENRHPRFRSTDFAPVEQGFTGSRNAESVTFALWLDERPDLRRRRPEDGGKAHLDELLPVGDCFWRSATLLAPARCRAASYRRGHCNQCFKGQRPLDTKLRARARHGSGRHRKNRLQRVQRSHRPCGIPRCGARWPTRQPRPSRSTTLPNRCRATLRGR